MSDAEVPEADALEQSEAVDPQLAADVGVRAPDDLEAPEADALEQSTPVAGSAPRTVPAVGLEVPAADAQEQAADLGEDDDHDR